MKYIVLLLVCVGFYGVSSAQTTYTLQRAFRTAKENNPYLKASALGIEAVKADIITAQLRPNPVLNNQSLQLMKNTMPSDQKYGFNARSQQTWWQITKPMQVAGQRENKIELAKRNVDVAEKSYVELERELLVNVANRWIDVWIAQRRLNYLSTAIKYIDSLVNINTYRFQKQVITETELYRTQLISKQYAVQLNRQKEEYRQNLNNLKLVMGVSETVGIDNNEQTLIKSTSQIDSLVQVSLSNRSDYQILVSAEKAAESNIKLQKSLAIPQPEIGMIYNPQNTVPYLGVFATIGLPFFDKNQGGIQKAKVQREQIQAQMKANELSIEIEIINANNQLKVYKKNLEEYDTIIKTADEVLDNVSYAYKMGGTTIIDFLEAQRSWIDTQEQYYEVLQEYKQSQIQLLNVTGLINKLAN